MRAVLLSVFPLWLIASPAWAQEAEEAEAVLREAMGIRLERHPLPVWKIAYCRSILGAALTAQRRHREAEVLLVRSLEPIREDRGPHDPRTVDSLRRVVDLYRAWGKPEKATEYQERLDAALRGPNR